MVLISVIIPAHNAASTLAPCLDSVITQSGDFSLEVIVVDDGSTDSTPDIIASYQQRNPEIVRALYLPRRIGQATARNMAIDVATGRWLIFVDADDLLPPAAIATLLGTALTFPAPIACGAYARRQQASAGTPRGKSIVIESKEALATLLYQTDPSLSSSLWGKLFSRHLFDDLRLWDGHIYEDLDIMPRLFLRANAIAVTSAVVYVYRRNSLSTLSVWNQRRKDMLDVTARILALPDIVADPRLIDAARDRAFSAACNCLINMLRHRDHDLACINRCLSIIISMRRHTLASGRPRLKNRLTALLSCIIPASRKPINDN